MVDKDERKAEVAEHLKDRIRAAMDASPKTQDEIAEEIGVSKAAVSKWARTGSLELHNLYALALATTKPPGWFFPGFRAEEGSSDAATRLDQILDDDSADSDFLESALLSILMAKQRASNSSQSSS